MQACMTAWAPTILTFWAGQWLVNIFKIAIDIICNLSADTELNSGATDTFNYHFRKETCLSCTGMSSSDILLYADVLMQI